MPLKPELLKILVCPKCKKQVAETPGGILCRNCGLIYPVQDGIPVMLVEEAKPAK